MRIVILTQNDPFYLAKNIEYLVAHLPAESEIVACVLFKPSPYGKKMSFLEKATSSLRIFGLKFFAFYSWLLIRNVAFRRRSVYSVLKKSKIPTIELQKPVNHRSSIDIIRGYNPDLLISIAGNQIFKKELISLAPKGCLNLHTALLPKYRGLMPTFWVMKNNERETGVSVFFVDEGIDSGPIIVQKRITIGSKTQRELIHETKELGMRAIIEAIGLIENGAYNLLPNDERFKTYFSFPTRADVKVFKKNGKKFF